jgi:hypothetical protein
MRRSEWMGSDVDDLLGVDEVDTEELKNLLIGAIIDYERNRPRSLQKEIGPSQAGSVCSRRLALIMSLHGGDGDKGDPLPSMVGTAMHGTMDLVMQFANEKHGWERFLTEKRVERPIAGTCDLYDNETKRVLDWKFPGPTAFAKYRKLFLAKNNPQHEYREQIHLYGLGYENLGYDVEEVGLIFLPRAGRLRDMHIFLEPFNRKRAEGIGEKIEHIKTVSEALELSQHPERAKHIPATASDACGFCPFWAPVPVGPLDCVGNAGDPNA